MSKGLARIQHLVTQLLALAKQDVSLSVIEPTRAFQLNDVALNCVEQLVNLAMQKKSTWVLFVTSQLKCIVLSQQFIQLFLT